MKVTKLEHSGMILEKSGKKLVFDPVEIEATLPEVDDVVAIIITHKHGDHLQLENLQKILARNTEAKLLVAHDVELDLPNVQIAQPGAELGIAGFSLQIFGNNHAEIDPGNVPCANIGVVVDGAFVNPGDSFDLPVLPERIKLLCVPSAAPWCRLSESMAYLAKAQPEKAMPVHNAVLSKFGNQVCNNWLSQCAEQNGIEFLPLEIGESVEI